MRTSTIDRPALSFGRRRRETVAGAGQCSTPRCLRRLLLLSALLAVGCGPSGDGVVEVSRDRMPDDVLRSYVESGRIPGVVAVAATSREVLHQGAFGKKSADAEEAMALDTIFRIYSMTKPVTSVAVMQLVEQGTVELDVSVGEYLPELARPRVLEGFGEDGTPQLRDASRPPTIRELLSNTSGYAYGIWNADIRRYEVEAGLPDGRDRFPLLPLASDPGTRWEYSPSTAILGVLVEAVSGLTLEEYFKRNIFQPLGMSDSFFQIPADKWGRVVRRHKRLRDGSIEVLGGAPPVTPPQVTYFAGDGGLSSTAPDYLRFVRALLNGGELDGARILKTESVDQMGANQIGEFEAAGNMVTVQPGLSNDVNLYPGVEDRFGLGFLLNAESVADGRGEGTMMWAGLMNTYFWVDRGQDVGGVLLTQTLPFGDATVLELLGEYEKAVYSLSR